MRNIFLAILLAVGLSPGVLAQAPPVKGNLTAASSDCSVANSCITIYNTIGASSVAFTLGTSSTGSWSANFEALGADGSSWSSFSVRPSNGTTAVSTASASGNWSAAAGSYTAFRIRLSPYSSGTAAAALNLTTGSASSGTGGSSTSPSGNPAYTGLVATHGDINNSTVGVGTTWIMDRSIHFARTDIPANTMKVVWGNWYVNGSNQELGTGTGTYKYSVEYPSGTITACTIGGQTTASIASLANAVSDVCNPTIPSGAAFWIRTLYTNTGGGIIFTSANFSSSLEGTLFGSGTPTDLTGGGAVGNTSCCGVGFKPYAIIGTTTLPSVCLIGDSRVSGQGDFPNDATVDTGELARSIGPVYAYTKISVPGTSIGQAIANFTHRLTITQWCSNAGDEYGINDIGGGASAATVAGNRTSLAGLIGIPTFGTTLPTETTSTDSWATIANQTSTGNPSVVQTFNGLVRAGISGENACMDIAYVVDPTAIGKWPVAPNIFATTGTANFGTPDGVHENNTLNQIIQRSQVVNVNWIKY